jgi:hypothetical protein
LKSEETTLPNDEYRVNTTSGLTKGAPVRRQQARNNAIEQRRATDDQERLYRRTGYQDYSDIFSRNGYKLQFFSFVYGREVEFKAWMDGFTDSFTTNWNSEAVFGRPDPYRIYQNTERTLSISFKILAGSVEEAKANLESMNVLAKMNYPTYSEPGSQNNAATIKGAPLMKFKFVNLITSAKGLNAFGDAKTDGLIGVLDGVTFDFKLSEGVLIDTVEENGGQGKGSIFPKQVDVSFNFHVLHDHFVGFHQNAWQGASQFPYGTDESGNESVSFRPPYIPRTLPSISGLRPRGEDNEPGAVIDPDLSSRGEFRAFDETSRTPNDIEQEENDRTSTPSRQIQESIVSGILGSGERTIRTALDEDGAPPRQLVR